MAREPQRLRRRERKNISAGVAHVKIIVDIPETVGNQTVLHLLVTKSRLLAGAIQVVWHTGHVLHATSYLRLSLPQLN